MKRLIIVITLCIFATPGFSQILHPVKWSYGAKRLSNNEAILFLKANIDDGWHIYSTSQKDGGPVKTSFTFNPSTAYLLSGKVVEPMPTIQREVVFNMDVSYFEHEVIFSQKIKLTQPATITGTLNFMVCNNKQCLPPESLSFAIQIN